MRLTYKMHEMLIDDFRDDLASAGFGVDALTALWGQDAAAALHRGHRLPAERALAALDGGGRLGTLAALFVLGLSVPADAVSTALPRLGLDGGVELGLLAIDGEFARPRLDVRPYGFTDVRGTHSWWIASDLGELALGTAIPEHHVLGVGGASTTLSGLMIQDEVDTVLDLGTGCGIQALHASRFAKRVIATDISQRALDLAALNARLNGVDSIEFRLGSLFEPVAGERFDRIVSNPPFVITPRVEGVPAYEYRDGGLVGDELVETVIRGAFEHLAPGGIAQLLGNWEYREGEDALARVEGWTAGRDAWVVEREVQDAALYAETWIRDGGTRPGTARFDELYAAWLDDFEARGVTAVGFGYVTLRAANTGLARFERLDGSVSRLGEHLGACLDAHDWLASADLVGATLTLASDVTEERHYWPGDEDPTVIDIRQGGGFARTVPAGTTLAAVVGACDGDLSIGAICGAIAQLLDLDESALLDEVLPSVRELVATGMLVP
jgi:hypothetical protein